MKKGNKNRRNIPKKTSYDNDNQLISLFKIIGVLVIIFGLFYGLTAWRTMDKTKKTNEETETEIQYDEILIGTIMNQTANEYYVLVADLNADDYSKYETYVSSFENSTKLRIYTSDSKNIFNRSYISDTTNASKYVNKTSIKDITFSDDCLVHVKKVKNKKGNKENKIVDVFIGEEKILEQLSKIVKDD